ncbi:MAG: hypothetical protein AAFX04_05815 [Pseudomonadota bacterium]
MTTDRKIYSIGDSAAENDGVAEGEDSPATLSGPPLADETEEDTDNAESPYETVLDERLRDTPTLISAITCSLLGLGWTAAWLWSGREQWINGADIAAITSLIAGWSGPVLILLIIHLLISRRRRADAHYFERQVIGISEASHLLEERLRASNAELSMAREFLGNQATQLDSLGRTAIEKLTERAEHVRGMIDGSDKSMQSIADVSAIAEQNLDALRTNMPVVTTSAKDMANQIGNVGHTAKTQLRDMATGMERVNAFGQATNAQIDDLDRRISEALKQWQDHIATLEGTSQSSSDQLLSTSKEAAEALEAQQGRSLDALQQFERSLREHIDNAGATLQQNISEYGDAIASLAQQRTEESEAIGASIATMAERLRGIRTELTALDTDAADQTAKMAFAITALNSEIANVSETLEASRQSTEQLIERSAKLRDQASSLSGDIGDTLDEKATALAETLAQSAEHGRQSRAELDTIMAQGREMEKLLENTALSLTDQEQHIERVQGNFGAFVEDHQSTLGTIDSTLETIGAHMDALSDTSKTRLAEAFQDIRDNAELRLAELEQRLTDITANLAGTMGSRSEDVLETAMRNKSEEVIGKLQLALNQALGATREASTSLVEQLGKVDALTANLETRVEQARERAELRTDQEFTRNMALITESLNSASIDITKNLSNDVTDTAWAAYLKGDRGVFTRRAVRLLNAGEVREIAQHYEQEPEFQETVNRYIHDFEAMLRDLLSTRNGEAISVTLLSSDMGKLYVALAQAIERFR